jgi:hypothetical protein
VVRFLRSCGCVRGRASSVRASAAGVERRLSGKMAAWREGIVMDSASGTDLVDVYARRERGARRTSGL